MRVFITGSQRGQLHWELLRSCPDSVEIVGTEPRLDLGDSTAIQKTLSELAPDVVINAAAYTAVDRAESEPEKARLINHLAVVELAEAVARLDARLLHVSTDFVFGASNGVPHSTTAHTDPVNVYGQTKLAGEQAVLQRVPQRALIMRTSWVYSSHGSNFVKTMLRLMRERGEVSVVADQVGSPTWANSLAKALWAALALEETGIMHWTGGGVATWYDLAVAIADAAKDLGILPGAVAVHPLTTAQYPTPASRPHYTVLDCTETHQRLRLRADHWRHELAAMLGELCQPVQTGLDYRQVHRV